MKVFMVAIDGSPESQKALGEALSLMQQTDYLYLIHVVNTDPTLSTSSSQNFISTPSQQFQSTPSLSVTPPTPSPLKSSPTNVSGFTISNTSGSSGVAVPPSAVRSAEALLEECASIVEALRFRCSTILKMGTNPGEIIANEVLTNSVDYLVVGRRGMSRMKRMFAGSVSSYLINNANCTVIVSTLRNKHNAQRTREINFVS